MKINIYNGNLNIQLKGAEKIWALKGKMSVPLSAITCVRIGKPVVYNFAFRLPGTFVPCVIKAGTYWSRSQGWEFWYVTRKYFGKALILGVNYNKFSKIVLGIDNVEAIVQKINEQTNLQ
jgi:hypothetical protein